MTDSDNRFDMTGESQFDAELLPDFLGIGAQKSGTTWLAKNLGLHPQTFLSQQKELHFFNRNLELGLGWYCSHFEEGRGLIKGEVTPAYFALVEDRLDYLVEHLPDVRVWVLLRDPIARAWSHARMDLVRDSKREFDDVDPEEFLKHFQSRPSVRRGAYLENLERWERRLPSDRIFIGFFEDIAKAPEQLLRDVFQFLGLSTDIDWSGLQVDQKWNPGLSAPLAPVFREALEAQYGDAIEALYARFGERVAHWRRR